MWIPFARGVPRADRSTVVGAEDADDYALDADAVGLDDAGLHRVVGGLEADLAAFLEVALEGGLAGVEERDDLFAVAGGVAAFDDDVVAVAEVVFDHGFAADAEDVDAGAGLEHGFEVDFLAVFDGFDGGAGGDVTQERELGASVFVGEALVGDDLEGTGLVLVATEDALLLERADVLEDRDLAGAELVGELLHG